MFAMLALEQQNDSHDHIVCRYHTGAFHHISASSLDIERKRSLRALEGCCLPLLVFPNQNDKPAIEL
jgi:hypothetical protein